MASQANTEFIHNLLLRALPKPTMERLRPHLQHVALPQGLVIDRANEPIPHIYFVNCGFVSMVKTMRDGRSVEIGGVGIEGITAPGALLGRRGSAVLDAVVQIPGAAFRIERTVLREIIDEEPPLATAIESQARYLLGLIAQTAACNRLHSVEERCCRWLLIAYDNALADRFALTHEFLAMMLGTQRAGVTVAARQLKKAGLIDYARGSVTITDRPGLEKKACECYRANRDEIETLYPRQTGRA